MASEERVFFAGEKIVEIAPVNFRLLGDLQRGQRVFLNQAAQTPAERLFFPGIVRQLISANQVGQLLGDKLARFLDASQLSGSQRLVNPSPDFPW